MTIRAPYAERFYEEASEATIRRYIEHASFPEVPRSPHAAILPHAGWFFSGKTAAKVFALLKQKRSTIKTFLFFGAVHRLKTRSPALFAEGAWETPFGRLPVNEALAGKLLAEIVGLTADEDAHRSEHSIEVSLPFIRHFYPEADFIPIACPPGCDAVSLGQGAAEKSPPDSTFILATSDLTHCGAGYGIYPPEGADLLSFAKENDQRMLDLITALDTEAIEKEAQTHHNACGAAAITAACAAAKQRGAREGILVDYATSNDALPEDPPTRVVGYAGFLLC